MPFSPTKCDCYMRWISLFSELLGYATQCVQGCDCITQYDVWNWTFGVAISFPKQADVEINWVSSANLCFVFSALPCPENCRLAMRPVLSPLMPTQTQPPLCDFRPLQKMPPNPGGEPRILADRSTSSLSSPAPVSDPRIKETWRPVLGTPGRSWCPRRGL